MQFEVEYWEDENKNSPPYNFYDGLDSDDQTKFDKFGPDFLEEYGIQRATQTKYCERFKGHREELYELKVTCRNKMQLRAFICGFEKIIYILEMFWKKAQNTIPQKHIDNAIARYKQLTKKYEVSRD